MKYRKKPIIIDAFEWTGDAVAMDKFLCGDNDDREYHGDVMMVVTLEGDMEAHLGDMIIRGVKGEFYPCKPDIFALTYDTLDPNAGQRGYSDAEIIDTLKKMFGQTYKGEGVPESSPNTSSHTCQYCDGPLDATNPVGIYECPACLKRFPNTRTVAELEAQCNTSSPVLVVDRESKIVNRVLSAHVCGNHGFGEGADDRCEACDQEKAVREAKAATGVLGQKKVCGHGSPDGGYACTREYGHALAHCVGDPEHPSATWPNNSDFVPVGDKGVGS